MNKKIEEVAVFKIVPTKKKLYILDRLEKISPRWAKILRNEYEIKVNARSQITDNKRCILGTIKFVDRKNCIDCSYFNIAIIGVVTIVWRYHMNWQLSEENKRDYISAYDELNAFITHYNRAHKKQVGNK